MVYLSARASSFSLIARSLLDFSCRSPSVSNWISVSNLKNRVRESKSNFKLEIDFEKGYMAWRTDKVLFLKLSIELGGNLYCKFGLKVTVFFSSLYFLLLHLG